jgi:hypothetical protein
MLRSGERPEHDIAIALSVAAYLFTAFMIGLAIGTAAQKECRMVLKTVAPAPVEGSYRTAK